MSKIYIVPIEPIDTRYTRQWYEHLPLSIEKFAKQQNKTIDIVVIDGEQVPPVPTPGAFLDFGATNIYKSSQLGIIANEFQHGKVSAGDKFLFTDAWNPMVIAVKYMSELLNVPVEIHGMWHAGSYDPHDFLGRLIGNKPWVRTSERAMFECYNTNWFATDFHKKMFVKEILHESDLDSQHKSVSSYMSTKKLAQTGWPMDYLLGILVQYKNLPKKNQIVFPHRIAPEKQLDIFKDLAVSMPQFNWITCQEQSLTKHEYHTILGESKIVFSANLQETFGISMIEGLVCQAAPLVPDRLSYSEMYLEQFKYPSAWTENFDAYITNKAQLIKKIEHLMSVVTEPAWKFGNLIPQQDKLCNYIYPLPLLRAMIT
jgi:hypothetical protein